MQSERIDHQQTIAATFNRAAASKNVAVLPDICAMIEPVETIKTLLVRLFL